MGTQKFCLLATERTGSNFVRELLRLIPRVACHGELFNRTPPQKLVSLFDPRHRTFDFVSAIADRDRSPLAVLSQIERLTLETADMCGFKLMLQHQPAVLDHVLSSADYGLVVFWRRNKLAQYSSFEIAMTTDVWMNRGQPGHLEARVRFDERAFTNFVARQATRYDAVRGRLEATRRSYFDLEYTAITNEGTIEALLTFIGIQPDRPVRELLDRNPVVRQNTPNILDRFSNPEVVIGAMQKMGHEDWLSGEAL